MVDLALRNSEFNHIEDGSAYFSVFNVIGFKYNKEKLDTCNKLLGIIK